MRLNSLVGLAAGLLIPLTQVFAYDATDTIMDGDSAQSGYLPNHNMDPAVITGGSFGQIWRFTAPKPASGLDEQFYAKPLVYTPSSTGRQVVLAFSEQNKFYVIDAVNGTLYASRDLSTESPKEVPFLVSDIATCNDISGTIGITGTPVIDTTTDTVYFWAKSYLAGDYSATGWMNGAYYFHAVDAATLKERPGFPVSIQGHPADNDPYRVFTGGNVLQRASLNLINGVVYAGFGGHCDQYNYTGWLVGMGTDGKVKAAYATTGGAGSPGESSWPSDPNDWTAGGGGSGIWQAGAAIASDNSGRLFFATGNGNRGTVNQQQPASGRQYLSTLSECMVNMAIKANGSISQADYFEPYEYLAMDAGDRDLGSGAVCLPDAGTFSGGGVKQLAITVGKNGKAYITNADDMGGYKLGASGTDRIVQSISMPGGGSVFGQVGTYPKEGGYMYITPVGYPTLVYSLGFTSSGLPSFTKIAQTNDSSAGRVGVGPATVTTYKGEAGTAILWIVDVDAGVRAYHAVPVNGQMIPITLPASPAVSKFQRPAFGDGRYYLATSNGNILAYGSPIALPLNCTSPLNFGALAIGNLSTLKVTCTANIAIASLNGFIPGKSVFKVSNSSLPTGPVAKGQSFTFPVSFNLTNFVLTGGSSSAPSVSPGVQTTSISILTTNGVTGYSTEQPITVSGITVSASPFITMSPLEVDFAGIVLNTTTADAGSDANFIITNAGQAPMTIKNVTWTDDDVNPDPGEDAPDYSPLTEIRDGNGTLVSYQFDDDGHFFADASTMPNIGDVIQPGQSITVKTNFQSDDGGSFNTILRYETDGGSAYVVFVGSASTVPKAVLEYQNLEGWQPLPDCTPNASDPDLECTYTIDFGTNAAFSQSVIPIRMSNTGGSALEITKSKPPEGTVLGAQNPNQDLHEGSTINPNTSYTANVFFAPGAAVLNADDVVYSAQWTLNTNDLTFGIHVLNFTATLRSNKTGPANAAGQSTYKYLGCYLDNSNGARIEPKSSVNTTAMENGLCQTTAQAAGAVFAGSEYQVECWYGNVIPSASLQVVDSLCSYACAGDANQACGGNGGYMSVYYDSTRYFPANGTILGTSGKGPQIVQATGSYKYAGCWLDNVGGGRALAAKNVNDGAMTIEKCATICAGYSVFGVEYADECYCGNAIAAASSQAPDADCSMACAGSDAEFCGNGNRLSVYTANGTAPNATTPLSTTTTAAAAGTVASATSASAATPSSSLFSFVECHTDAVAARTMTGKQTAADGMTVEYCATFCAGFTYFGVEYGRECYCGNTLLASSSKATDGRCSMTCAGNAAEICGGPNGLSLYTFNVQSSSSSTSLAATSTSVSASAASVVQSQSISTVSGTGAASTGANSTSAASTQGASTVSGTSTATGLSVTSGTSTAPGASTAPGVSTATGTSAASGASTTAGTSTPTSTTSTSTSTPTPSSILSAYQSLGCITDNNVAARTLSGPALTDAAMTLEKCAAFCAKYTYFGVEYANECYCGNSLAAASATDGRCKMPCAGSSAEICGGSYGLNVYKLTASASASTSTAGSAAPTTTAGAVGTSSAAAPTTTPTGPAIVPAAGNFSYLHCHSDNTTVRTLQGRALADGAMTVERCAAACAGFAFFGVEYAQECYCGNALSAGSYSATDGRCGMVCAGAAGEYCGGPNGLGLYGFNASLAAAAASSTVGSTPVAGAATSLAAASSVAVSSAAAGAPSTSTSATVQANTAGTIAASSTSSAGPSPSTTTTAAPASLATSTASSDTAVTTSSTSSLSSVTTTAPTTSSTLPTTTSLAATSSTPSATASTTSTAPATSLPTSTTSPVDAASSISPSSTPSTTTATTSATSTTAIPTTSTSSGASTTTTPSATDSATSSSASSSIASTATSSGFSTIVTTSPTTTTPTPSGTTTTIAASSIPTAPADPWVPLGCVNDTVSARALNAAGSTSSSMTVPLCQAFCLSLNLPLAGVEYGGECYCGTSLAFNATSGFAGCNVPCAGNSSQTCGGANRLNVFNYTAYVAPRIVDKVGRYAYVGCYPDNVSGVGRTLGAYGFANQTGMTAEMCVGACSGRGFAFAGLEYGSECWCANSVADGVGRVQDDAACKAKLCPGDRREWCAPRNMLIVYQNQTSADAATNVTIVAG